MGIFLNSVSVAENQLQDMLKDLTCLQVSAMKANTKIRGDINKKVDEKIATYEENQKKLLICQKLAKIFGTITVFMTGLCLGIGALGSSALLMLATNIGGSALTTTGLLKIGVGSYQNKIANNKEVVGVGQAMEQYVTDRDTDLGSKANDSYEILATLTQAFNRQAVTYGRALQRRA